MRLTHNFDNVKDPKASFVRTEASTASTVAAEPSQFSQYFDSTLSHVAVTSSRTDASGRQLLRLKLHGRRTAPGKTWHARSYVPAVRTNCHMWQGLLSTSPCPCCTRHMRYKLNLHHTGESLCLSSQSVSSYRTSDMKGIETLHGSLAKCAASFRPLSIYFLEALPSNRWQVKNTPVSVSLVRSGMSLQLNCCQSGLSTWLTVSVHTSPWNPIESL